MRPTGEGRRLVRLLGQLALSGGQIIEADAPIEQIPAFVRAGSIVPIGAPVSSTAEKQALQATRVYPGRDARFTLYDDDGTTNAYR